MNRTLATLAATMIALAAPVYAHATDATRVVVGADGNAVAPTAEALPHDPESTTRGGLYASPEQAYRTKQRLGSAVLLIDVRPAEERRRSIVSAPVDLQIPFHSDNRGNSTAAFQEAVGRAVSQLPRGRATPSLVLCESGRLAAAAVDSLESAGYPNAIVVTGGLHGEVDGGRPGWIRAGLPVVSPSTTVAPRSAWAGDALQGGPSAGLTPLPYL